MFTIFPNEECGQTYKIKSDHIGQRARCKRCQTIFEIQKYDKKLSLIDLPIDDENDENQTVITQEKGKKRSPKQVMEERIKFIFGEVDEILPDLLASWERQENESDTRLLIDRVLQRALGFDFEDIKTEQRIEGRRADYVLSIAGEDKLVGEVKKMGMPLRDRQIFQATSYGAYAGIPWVFLTNGLVWQLYHVLIGEKVETNLVFTIDLKDGIDEDEAEYFYLISKWGMSRKGLLDKLWKKISTLCYDNIVSTILTDEIISKIRITLNKQSGASVNDDEVRSAVENNIFQLG